MAVEQCSQCGFDGSDLTDDEAIAVLTELPDRWHRAIEGIGDQDLRRRPVDARWSIAEYTDHVREVLFGMRFLLDTALAHPGTDLGGAPENRFDPEPRAIDAREAWAGFREEVEQLCERLAATERSRWSAWVIVDGQRRDIHWIARHAIHDVTHHLADITHLRTALHG